MKLPHGLIILFLVSLLLIPAQELSAGPLTNQELIEQVIKAYGGKQALEQLKSVYTSGNTVAYMLQDRGSYERFFRRNRKLRVITTYSRSSETRILNNKKGFRGTALSQLSEVSDHRLLAMIYQYKYLDMPYGLMTGAHAISSRKSAEFQGRDVEILRLIDPEGPAMDIFIDSEKFYIVKATGFFTIGSKTTDLSAEFSDMGYPLGSAHHYRLCVPSSNPVTCLIIA